METILAIPGKLEYLEGLIKLARKWKNEEHRTTNVASTTTTTPIVWRISVNKNSRSKTLHLLVEINNHIVEGQVDTRASMSIMVANVVRELGIMHLVIGFESYKIAFGMVM